MKIAGATLTRIRLQLREPIQTARGRLAVREGAVLALTTESGWVGYGEALPLDGFGTESVSQACDELGRLARNLLGRDPRDLDTLLDEAEASAPHAPCARAAVDCALFDLAARAAGTRVAELLSTPRPPRDRVRVSALLQGEQPEDVGQRAQQEVRDGFQTLKLKLGACDLALDEARVAAVRQAVGSDVKIRLDANGAWKRADAEQAMTRLGPYAIEFCEQPVPAHDLAGLARLRSSSPIAIAVDEALVGGRAVDEILQRDAADLLVLKPAVLGGLRACLRFAESARAKGVGCVVTSALDSALGLSAALQLAAALPGPLPDAGLATGASLVEDLAPAPLPSRGEIALPDSIGMGVAPHLGALARCALGKATEIHA